ncbi:hypothetical protein BKA70DRAFT_1249600 [Coprinopsis sp. MPI-PUGE-AT-0042]|nr:hypothetical protein BKA70DRAFT_1249600 [Coprinopsis sp. MPI-PUGE-AT-0042]
MSCTLTRTTSLRSDFHWRHAYPTLQRPTIRRFKTTTAAQPVEVYRGIVALEDTITQPDSAPSPVVLLPPEILTQVFSWAVHGGVTISYSPDATPWNIACVCKYWREASYSTPMLWNHIAIDWSHLPSLKPVDAKVYLERLGHIMSLSSPLPLVLHSVDFMKGGHGGAFLQDPDGSIWHLLDSIFQGVSHRLSGELPTWYLTRKSVADGAHSVTWTIPNITTLMVQPRARDLVSRSLMLNFPSLECLELDARVFAIPLASSASPRAAFPYLHSFITQHPTLRRLVWHDSPSRNFLRFADECGGFQEAPSLTELSLKGEVSASFVPLANNPPDPPAAYSQARSGPGVASNQKSPPFTSSPVTYHTRHSPAQLRAGIQTDPEPIRRNTGILQQSECQPTLVSLSLRGLDGVDLTRLLELTPNLLELTISSLWSSSMASNAALAPALRRITVETSNDEGVVATDILEDILSIRNPGKQVSSSKSFNKTWAFLKSG